jgi:taurine dioxygenase
VDVPPYGGDTIWCNTELAYECLSDAMKSLLAPLKVHMSAAGVLAEIDRITDGNSDSNKAKIGTMDLDIERQSMIAGSFHPLIRTHPVTGRKALYVEQAYSSGIEGMKEEEARPILDFLLSHITQASFSCRLRWQNNSFVAWDNRSTVHHAFNDYDGYRREMYRTTVLGEIPT